jgi:hypothetical protein
MDAIGKRIHPFIFNWVGHYERTLKLEAEFLELFDRVTVINSDENHEEDRWVNLGEDAYFTEQFAKAVELFDGDIMFHVQADAYSKEWFQIAETALFTHDKFGWGIYAPNVDYTMYTSNIVDLRHLGNNIRLVINTDCTAWFLDKDIINDFKNYMPIFKKTTLGWGACKLLCAITIKHDRLILRDYTYTVDHPKHTNYNAEKAYEELQILRKEMEYSDLAPYTLVKAH